MNRLKKIEACAFMPFEHLDLVFPYGLVLIEGIIKDAVGADSNGAGKTSLFDAITWCTFGKTMRGLKGDEIINEFLEEGHTFVRETWELGDEEELVIERYRKHSDFGDALRVFYSGTDISGPNAQKTIEDLLGISFNIFTHSIMFGQEVAKFGSLGDIDRKRLLDEILDLEVLERALRVVKLEIKDLEEKVEKITDEWNKKNTESETIQVALDDYKQRNEEYKQKYEEELTVLKDKRKEVRKGQCELSNALEKKNDELKAVKASLKTLTKQLDRNNDKGRKVDSEKGTAVDVAKDAYIVIHNKAVQLREELESVRALKTGAKCITCRQIITEKHRDAVVKELSGRLAKVEKDEEKAKEVHLAAFQIFETAEAEVKTDREQLTQKEKACEVDKEEFSTEIIRLSNKVGAIDNEVLALNTLVEEKEREKNPYKDLIKKAKIDLAVLEKELGALAKEVEGYNAQLSLLEFWKWGFGSAGLKSHILESITPMLNEIADGFSTKLTGGDIRIQFQTREQLKSRDDFAEKFGFSVMLSKGGSTYKHCSQGEKRRIDLIIMFSLQSLLEAVTGFTSNVVFYDEVFDHLDATGREFVLEFLAEESTRKETVFVITQEAALREYFQTVITVEKEKGISSLIC